MAELRFTILGCGSSGGVPRLGGNWGTCDPTEPKNARRRCALLVERITDTGKTRVLIDTGPDMRAQLLDAGVGHLSGVVYTHSHADHVHGIDDLRQVVYNMRKRLPVWADAPTRAALLERFAYVFVQPEGSSYPPILDLHDLDQDADVTIDGPGGPITLTPFLVGHGGMDALGFRVADLAYLPDVAEIYAPAWEKLHGLECWIVDALRRDPHPTHSHLSQTLEWIDRAAPTRAIITNMHLDMDYQTLVGELPDHIAPAFDGMTISYTI